ncbi:MULTISPECIES: hypothetical protein [Phenylobacterium]|uniref:Uncharacterized protein n=1 Tax=Phenylobacterium koreense TaxID=266125 RepID=A0ABV2EEG3_9CAUL
MSQRPSDLAQILFVPAVLAAVSGAGLVLALLVDGPLDALTWPAIGAPPAVILWALAKRRAPRH